MEIDYRPRAKNAILKVMDFVESKNTEGSGRRWFVKLNEVINSLSQTGYGLQICRHESLSKFNYRCYEYNGWVIVFRISNKKLEVCRFIWAAQIS